MRLKKCLNLLISITHSKYQLILAWAIFLFLFLIFGALSASVSYKLHSYEEKNDCGGNFTYPVKLYIKILQPQLNLSVNSTLASNKHQGQVNFNSTSASTSALIQHQPLPQLNENVT